ncbi:MAG: lipopolysaccharide transport periplasmic protein LptA [Alphaproteobacteria bacterium]|nr:lipopolysaccharide transport periplasmic protein LptA [Alphaproteobacteria bacterium]
MGGKAFLLWMIGSFLLVAADASAASPLGDSSQPIEITADSLEVLQERQAAVFSGKVEAIQGNVTLRSDRMTVFYNQKDKSASQNQISRIKVEGHVQLSTPEETVRGSSGVYDVDKELIQMSGGVELSRGGNIVQGSALEYDVKSGQSRVISAAATAPDGSAVKPGRVKALFVPEQKK